MSTKLAELVVAKVSAALSALVLLSTEERINVLNRLRTELHRYSPFKNEPVDLVQWIPADAVMGNQYNPNSVAPPEFKLLEHSILQDGFTQPIVAWQEDATKAQYEVVDGFHRNRVGKECKAVRKRIRGYLPLVIMNVERTEKNDRVAATIRHNRARGKHKVEAMSDIVVELKRRNWSDDRICRELGMDPDEVLRLCQITGLAELFSDSGFSKSWDVEGAITPADFEELTDDITTYGPEKEEFRTVNTSDESRIFHTHDKWECYKAGFYATGLEGMTKAQCENAYRDFLGDSALFADALEHVVVEWVNSCEHYLTNAAMNRIAWLGQAAACYALGVPSVYRGGFYLLTEIQQAEANRVALVYLNKWLVTQGRPEVTMEEAYSYERQSDIY